MNEEIGRHNQATVLAQFSDKKLRKGGSKLDEDAMRELLDSIC